MLPPKAQHLISVVPSPWVAWETQFSSLKTLPVLGPSNFMKFLQACGGPNSRAQVLKLQPASPLWGELDNSQSSQASSILLSLAFLTWGFQRSFLCLNFNHRSLGTTAYIFYLLIKSVTFLANTSKSVLKNSPSSALCPWSWWNRTEFTTEVKESFVLWQKNEEALADFLEHVLFRAWNAYFK